MRMNNADIAWMLVATALVLLMTPALAFFYGGLVRSKNALNTMMMSFVALGPVAVIWALLGYSLAFAPGNAFVGSLSYAGLRGVGMEAQGTIPHLLFMAFQGTFAIITPALISGAVAERMRFNAYLAFIVLWVVAVYAPVAHWVWGGGFLASMGALDFAGGAVVHVNAASAALVAALVVRRFCRTTCRSRCGGRGCCGSAGLASTPAARCRPAPPPRSPSPTRCWRRRPHSRPGR
jgi:Amt family ammonium transporter